MVQFAVEEVELRQATSTYSASETLFGLRPDQEPEREGQMGRRPKGANNLRIARAKRLHQKKVEAEVSAKIALVELQAENAPYYLEGPKSLNPQLEWVKREAIANKMAPGEFLRIIIREYRANLKQGS